MILALARSRVDNGSVVLLDPTAAIVRVLEIAGIDEHPGIEIRHPSAEPVVAQATSAPWASTAPCVRSGVDCVLASATSDRLDGAVSPTPAPDPQATPDSVLVDVSALGAGLAAT